MIRLEHTAQADARLSENLDKCWKKVLGRTEVGFPALASDDSLWEAIDRRAREVRQARRALVLGIGGSSLGTQVINQSLRRRDSTEITFLESPDPGTWSSLGGLSAPEWKDRHIVLISKSGNTLETLSWAERLAAEDAGWLANSQLTVVASPGSGPLQKWAEKERVPCLWIPPTVGGRFSVLTAVGMFPAALLGLNLKGFREGARWALDHPDLATVLSASILKSWERGEWITQMWVYTDKLRVFGEWWQQLWGESLGKRLDRAGKPASRASTPMACCGPRDQHSLVQQLIEGARDKFVMVTRVESVEQDRESFRANVFAGTPVAGRDISLGRVLGAEAMSFEKSLAESGIQFSTMHVKEISERSLGALFMLWQMCIAQLGEYMGIDAFNQPGVELGKKYANEILRG